MSKLYNHNVITNLTDELSAALLYAFDTQRVQLIGRRVWLACSGGRDSLALAHLCLQLYHNKRLPFLPQLLHVDHGMQQDSRRWAQHVRHWAKALDYPITCLQAQVIGNDEAAARQARYQMLMQPMRQQDVLLLAHHQDDQIETVLMRLFNGAGINGLAGMRPWSKKQFVLSDDEIKIIYLWRPWLNVSRQTISDYANKHKLNYIDDPTNIITHASTAKANDRAWLRSVLIPTIQHRYPAAKANIARSANVLSQVNQVLNKHMAMQVAAINRSVPLVTYQSKQPIGKTVQTYTPNQLHVPTALCPLMQVLNLKKLTLLAEDEQAAVVYYWLKQNDMDLPPSAQLVTSALDLACRHDHDHQTRLFWQNQQRDYYICRYQNNLYLINSQWFAWLQTPINKKEVDTKINFEQLNSTKALAIKDKNQDVQQVTLRRQGGMCWTVSDLPYLAKLVIQQLIKRQIKKILVQGNVAFTFLATKTWRLAVNSSIKLRALGIEQTLLQHIMRSAINRSLKQQNELVKSVASNRQPQYWQMPLLFEPLPKTLRLYLPNRQGSKAGKKLLQALRIPAFMRSSVVLMSLTHTSHLYTHINWHLLPVLTFTNVDMPPASFAKTRQGYTDNFNCNRSEKIPLMLITPTQMSVLASPVSQAVFIWQQQMMLC